MTMDIKILSWSIRVLVPGEMMLAALQSGRILGTITLSHDPPPPAAVTVTLERRWQAVYMSRESERVYLDGVLMGFLPPEPDHGPDDWVELPRQMLVDGGSATTEGALEILRASAPANGVTDDQLESFIASVEELLPR